MVCAILRPDRQRKVRQGIVVSDRVMGKAFRHMLSGQMPCRCDGKREACMSCSMNKETTYLDQRGLEAESRAEAREELPVTGPKCTWYLQAAVVFFWVLRSYWRTLKRQFFLTIYL